MSAPPPKKETGKKQLGVLKEIAEKTKAKEKAAQKGLGITMEFSKFFRGQEKYYGQMISDRGKDSKKGRRGWTASDGLSGENWEKHIQGVEPSLGIVPIMDDGTCYFAAIDYDDHDADTTWIESQVRKLGLPLVVCRSKSGGAHLYLFLTEPVKAMEIRMKLQQWLAMLKLENPDGRSVEIFPKQTKVTNTTQGNWIALPYFGGDNDQLRYAVKNGERLSLAAFVEHAGKTAVSRKEFLELFIDIPDSPLGKDAPPCLQILDAQGVAEGGRNTFLFNLGILYKQMDPKNWQDKLEEYNNLQLSPPMSSRDVSNTIRSLERKEYVYQCDEQPLSTCCYDKECSLRKFGVTHLKSSKTGSMKALPELTDLIKIRTDPPLWSIMIDGCMVEGLETDDILQLNRFRRAVMNKANIVYPNVKLDQWLNAVRRLMNGVQEVEAPEDAGVLGMFKGYFRQFLRNYRRASTKEDITKGQPYLDMPPNTDAHDEGARYEYGKMIFRSQDLFKYLRDEHRFREYTQAQMYVVCRKLGAKSTEMCINKTGVKVWIIPYAFIQEQRENFHDDENVKGIDI